MTYEAMMPAYRHGFDARSDSRYSGKEWAGVESDLRKSWESRYASTPWEKVKGAVQHAWQSAKSAVGVNRSASVDRRA